MATARNAACYPGVATLVRKWQTWEHSATMSRTLLVQLPGRVLRSLHGASGSTSIRPKCRHSTFEPRQMMWPLISRLLLPWKSQWLRLILRSNKHRRVLSWDTVLGIHFFDKRSIQYRAYLGLLHLGLQQSLHNIQGRSQESSQTTGNSTTSCLDM